MLKRFLLAIAIILAASLPTAAQPAPGVPARVTSAPVTAPVIMVFGDSLSAAYGIPIERGWVSLLQQRLAEQGYPHTVVNASISGETTRGGLGRISVALAAHHPAIVIVELGANDGLRGLPSEDMRRNLIAIIEQCRKNKARVLLVGMLIPPNYGPLYTQQIQKSYEAIAKQFRLPPPPFMLEGVAGNTQLIQEDGLHPKTEAQPRILDNIWGTLQPLLRKR